MSIYRVDKWSLLKIDHNGDVLYKVLAGWYGGYTGSDSWKLSSGAVSVEVEDDWYNITNNSGSIYCCRKDSFGFTSMTRSVLQSFEELIVNTTTKLEVVPEDKVLEVLQALNS